MVVVAVQQLSPRALPVASAADCADAEVVFARGTDEPKGLGVVGDAFVDSLRAQADGMNIASYGVDYDAGKLQLGTGDGAKDVIKHVKSMAASCPDTKIVLGGYSQGADVVNIVAGNPIVGIAWGDALPSSMAVNIAAIATFGNVANRSGTKLPSQSTMFAGKAIDLCNPADPICHAGPGNAWSGHTDGYVPVYTTQAADFAAAKLLAGRAPLGPTLGPPSAYGQPPGSVPDAPIYASPPQGTDHMPPGYQQSPAYTSSEPGYAPSVVAGLP
ncbi:cutinase family protein [Mycolicibacterium hodleri]